MRTRRKTIEIERIKELANKFFRESKDEMMAERKALQSFIETILYETNTYYGFNYVHWLEKGFNEWIEAGEPDGKEKYKFFGDETRIIFY